MLNNEQLTQELLEKIGGNSATILLDNSGVSLFVSTASKNVLQIDPEDLVDKNLVESLPLYTLESQPVDEIHNPVYKAVNQKGFIQTTPFFCKLSDEPDAQTYALNTIRLDKSDKVVVQIRKAKREVDVGEMKTLFLSFAAHQLKTPSSVVKGFLELMMRQGEASYSKEQWHFLTSAFESNENLIGVSKMLLNMSRLEGGLIEPNILEFDPHRSLQSKIASFASLYKTKRLNVNLSSSEEGNAKHLRTDETFFLEIFGIILGNAIKHSPIAGEIKVSCVLRDNNCEVHVIDNGSGIPQAVKEKLFVKGQDSSEKENSHGLGLYMAKKYIALLNGAIGLKDAVENETGSDFYFIVPNIQNN